MIPSLLNTIRIVLVGAVVAPGTCFVGVDASSSCAIYDDIYACVANNCYWCSDSDGAASSYATASSTACCVAVKALEGSCSCPDSSDGSHCGVVCVIGVLFGFLFIILCLSFCCYRARYRRTVYVAQAPPDARMQSTGGIVVTNGEDQA